MIKRINSETSQSKKTWDIFSKWPRMRMVSSLGSFSPKLRHLGYSESSLKNLTVNNKFSFWCLLLFLVAFHIVFGLRTVSLGGQLSELEKEEKILQEDIKDLNQSLISSTSLTKIKENSPELGFLKPITTLYLNDTDFVAQLPY